METWLFQSDKGSTDTATLGPVRGKGSISSNNTTAQLR